MRIGKYLRVRHENSLGSGIGHIACTDYFERFVRNSAFKPDRIDLSVTLDFDSHPFRQGVDYGSANAMESAGHTIGPSAEFAAGMEYRMDHFDGRNAHFGVVSDRNSGTVVNYGNGTVRIDRNINRIAATRQRLVNRIRHNLVYEVMEASKGRITDIHTGALSNGF